MNNFFATPEGGWGDGSVHLTTVGIAIVIAVIALLLIVAAIVRHKNATHKSALTTKQLVYSAVAIALAVVCSMIKLFDMPMGGSVTLLSMLFIVLIAYWYGPYVGIMTAVAYGLVQFVLEPIFYTIPQMLLDTRWHSVLWVLPVSLIRKSGDFRSDISLALSDVLYLQRSPALYFSQHTPRKA